MTTIWSRLYDSIPRAGTKSWFAITVVCIAIAGGGLGLATSKTLTDGNPATWVLAAALVILFVAFLIGIIKDILNDY